MLINDTLRPFCFIMVTLDAPVPCTMVSNTTVKISNFNLCLNYDTSFWL